MSSLNCCNSLSLRIRTFCSKSFSESVPHRDCVFMSFGFWQTIKETILRRILYVSCESTLKLSHSHSPTVWCCVCVMAFVLDKFFNQNFSDHSFSTVLSCTKKKGVCTKLAIYCYVPLFSVVHWHSC